MLNMTKREALAHFKNASEMAEALGISRSAVSQWGDDDQIPPVHELRIRYELRPEAFDSDTKAAA